MSLFALGRAHMLSAVEYPPWKGRGGQYIACGWEQVDDVRAGSVKLGLTFKSGAAGGKTPSEVTSFFAAISFSCLA